MQPNNLERPRIASDWSHVFDPNATRSDQRGEWYTNDHTLVRDAAGVWHAIGIIGRRPPRPWTIEKQFFHCTTDDLSAGPWQEHPYPLVAEPAHEAVVWAPYIFPHGGRYHMFYAGGNRQPDADNGCSYGTLHLATSDDLFTWTRHDRNPLWADPGHARDPFIAEWGGRFYCYYTRTFHEADQRSCIFVRESPDLLHWSGPKLVHAQPDNSRWAGDAESPMVVRRGDLYYLFICLALTRYELTRVYWSHDPTHFPIENVVTDLPAHAAEVVDLGRDRWLISNTGWYRQGLYTAQLVWQRS